VLAPVEPGLGGFNITLFDDAAARAMQPGQIDLRHVSTCLVDGLAERSSGDG